MLTTKFTKPKRNVFRYYDLILGMSVAILIISNIVAVKLISFGSIITDGGALIFPLSYILGDILTEVYGYSYSRRAIWASFSFMGLAVLVFIIIGKAPGAVEWQNQAAYEAILGFVPRIVAASLIAYLFGQFINSFVLAKLKIITKGRKMWIRLVGSTFLGELADTIIFALIAFGGILHGTRMFTYIFIGWSFKIFIEIVMLPVSYKIIYWLKNVEQSDKYDYKTDFTPFSIKLD